ncbi:MAG: methylated-DNA--[protein]-cysteine S-methyltransferase, partial [Alphaproteobacteria bacterium]
MPNLSLPSPLGSLVLVETAGALARIDWGEGEPVAATPFLREAKRQLEAYFARRLTRFELP